MATRNVRAATSATTLELASDLPQALDLNDTPCWLCLATADDLSDRAQDTIYRLFDDNMSSVSAETSMQYMEFMKRIELFDPLTRYILALKSQPPSRPKSASGGKKKGNSQTAKSDRSGWLDLDPGDVLGYCSFRFDTEETLGLKDAEVIYCYELQISSEARRKGLARILMRRLEQIGAERKMQKAMLTCLKANTSALEFYDREGYKADEIDPTRMAEEESDSDSGGEDDAGGNVGSDGESDEVVDYVILSKALP